MSRLPPDLKVTSLRGRLIRQIARRAIDTIQSLRASGIRSIDLRADLYRCHTSGCPLRLDALLAADAMTFAQEIIGIQRHLDRTTGQLRGGYRPHFADNRAHAHAA